MSYFLKRTTKKNGLYLQIYETLYNNKIKRSYNKSFKTIGYVKDLQNKGIKDPITYYQNEVDKLNKKRIEEINERKIKLIGDTTGKNIGYFLLKLLWNKLNLNESLKLLNKGVNFDFDISELLESLVYSRVVSPCSKYKTYNEIIPHLFEKYNFSINQLYTGLEYLGNNYQGLIEILNHYIDLIYGRETDTTFFDCTNYFFEIDYEKDDKQCGPSKENRVSPIIGQALLLDKEGIPMGMKMYPGNESEQPKIREVIKELKETNNIKGKTIQVADKGLNSGNNIFEASKEGDGYIFSQSVHKLNEKEKKWILDQRGYHDLVSNRIDNEIQIKTKIDCFKIVVNKNGVKTEVEVPQKRLAIYSPSLAKKKLLEIEKLIEKAKKYKYSNAKKSEYGECSKYVNFVDENGEKAEAILNMKKIKEDKSLAGFNLLVTSETELSEEEIYFAYHNLWRIEETFRILKSQLKARPVYLQTQKNIYGHFLVCYYAITLIRILQFIIFKHKYNPNELIEFIRKLNVFDTGNGYINITQKDDMIFEIANEFNIPINHQFLSEREIKKLLNSKFRTLEK